MANLKSIVLITGANGGIGFELARQLLEDPSKHVLVGSRSSDKGEAAIKTLQLRRLPGTVDLLQLDVTSEESIKTAARDVDSKYGRLDALVNNAAIASPSGPLFDSMSLCFLTNATGPLLMVEAFAPLLQKSIGTARIVNVSSGVGSITNRLDATRPSFGLMVPQYRASKSALNMITAHQSVFYGGKSNGVSTIEPGFKVFAFCPGFTESNLSTLNTADQGAKPTSEGAAPIFSILNGERDSEHGRFLHEVGQYPW